MKIENGASTPTLVKTSPEVLSNQEAFLVTIIGRVINGNDTFRLHNPNHKVISCFKNDNPRHRELRNRLNFRRLNSFPQLTQILTSSDVAPDIRNGIGRQVFKTFEDNKKYLEANFAPEILEERFPAWLVETFGKDRVDRWNLERDRTPVAVSS